ncbi:unnamed protein product, partial [marine sediment metagenome]
WLMETIAPLLKRTIISEGGISSELYQKFAKIIIDMVKVEPPD